MRISRFYKPSFFDKSKNMISETYDIQCYNKRLGDKDSYWSSIVRDLARSLFRIKKLLDTSKVFAIRINREESEVETKKKINEMLLKIKDFKN